MSSIRVSVCSIRVVSTFPQIIRTLLSSSMNSGVTITGDPLYWVHRGAYAVIIILYYFAHHSPITVSEA